MAENNNSMSQKRAPGGPRGPVGAGGAKLDKGILSLLGRVVAYVLKNYKVACIFVVIGIIGSALATLCLTLFSQSLIDDYITPLINSTVKDYSSLAQALSKLAVVLILGIICNFAHNRIMVNVSQGTMNNLRKDIFSNMETLAIKYFDTHPHGDIMSVYTNDVDTLRQLISQSLPQLINSSITLIATFVSMIVLSVPLTGVAVVMVIIMLIITSRFSSISGRYFVKQQNDLGKVNGFIEEMTEGQKVVKVFCHEEKNKEEFKKLNDELRDSAYNAQRISNIAMPVNSQLGNLSYVLIAVVGAFLAIKTQSLTLGTLVAFLTLSKNFSRPIAEMSQQLGMIIMAAAGAKRAFALMDETPEDDKGTVKLCRVDENEDDTLTETTEKTNKWAWKRENDDGTADYRRLKGEIIFKDVDFSYDDSKQILFDINMYATPGQKLAFVGSTGAGKTTITNLINRFYDIQQGSITFDGIDVSKISKNDLRRSLGMVLQDTNLFTGTVMENIRYGRLDATDEDCIRAAKLANADGFIRRLPDGYNTVLRGSGSNLSQGQRQLISIARTAVADPPVLILDEATSSIDTRTEQLVQQGMNALMEGRTSFVIAHRLSTVKNSDCIMVLEKGKIIERGSHDDLLAQKGRYYTLYTGNQITE